MVSQTGAVPDIAGTSCVEASSVRRTPEERKIEARERKRMNRTKNPEFNRLNDLWARVRKEKAKKSGLADENEVKEEIRRRLIIWNKKENGQRDWLAINEERKRRYKNKTPELATTPSSTSSNSTDPTPPLIPQMVNGELKYYTAKEIDLAYGLLALANSQPITHPRPNPCLHSKKLETKY